ncbi:hypothetical protein BU16DRAFT_51725 [Lophium mytilinum]|uniref:Uncharacterized protein n=1 Tax=Lophium mytilinum TaxID=390894 RepID=A0A6A6QRJ8_9PEZI|nr:hypothetical protein BU16DRAFT_51725 [Lophium mytilinum]
MDEKTATNGLGVTNRKRKFSEDDDGSFGLVTDSSVFNSKERALKVTKFAKIADIDRVRAKKYLRVNRNDLDLAINHYFDDPELFKPMDPITIVLRGSDKFTLPHDLFISALDRFDSLVEAGEILYSPSDPERTKYDGFEFEFRIVPAMGSKPLLAANDPGRSHPQGPFVNPDPAFVLANVGTAHVLELNKFCVFRPMLILHTAQYSEQEDDLDASDLTAAWLTLQTIKEPQIVLYNCGVDSGSSQGHKHLQFWPHPDLDNPFYLPPDGKDLPSDAPTMLPELPYQHWVVGIPPKATAVGLIESYFVLLKKAREALGKEDGEAAAYNLLFTRVWMIIIPRTQKGYEGLNANGAGMLGSVWVKDKKEREEWTKHGMTEHLTRLGLPVANELPVEK